MNRNTAVPVPAKTGAGWSVGGHPGFSPLLQILIGITAGLFAVGVRYLLPLTPQQLPTLPLVVTLAIVTTFVGVWAGIATAVMGGLLSWYFFFNPLSWSIGTQAWIPLVGYVVISTVIVTTAHLYRRSERRHHDKEVAGLQARAATSELFARELAHRQKNVLAVVQSIAFQTIGPDSDVAQIFAGRIKALADANDLLAEHVERPTARAEKVIEVTLVPFGGIGPRISVAGPGGTLAAQQAVMLALAVHELGTNATKYGSLSVPAGSVAITLTAQEDRLAILWTEAGGPAVATPERTGFGTRLLQRAGLGTILDYRPEGLHCRIEMKLAEPAGRSPSS